MLDVDELLVPRGNRTLVEFLHKSQDEGKYVDAISFMNVYYGTNASQTLPSQGHFILGNTKKASKPLQHGKAHFDRMTPEVDFSKLVLSL